MESQCIVSRYAGYSVCVCVCDVLDEVLKLAMCILLLCEGKQATLLSQHSEHRPKHLLKSDTHAKERAVWDRAKL